MWIHKIRRDQIGNILRCMRPQDGEEIIRSRAAVGHLRGVIHEEGLVAFFKDTVGELEAIGA